MWTYRIKYAKRRALRFISHLDTMRALKRAIARAEIPVAFSEGFNPRPKISVGPALPLGCESECELAEIALTRMLAPDKLHGLLEAALPEGLALLETLRVGPPMPKLSSACSVRYMIELPEDKTREDADSLVKAFNEKDSALVERKRKDKDSVVDVKQFVSRAGVEYVRDSAWLSVEIELSERGTCNPMEAAQAVFGISSDRAKCLRAIRVDIEFPHP